MIISQLLKHNFTSTLIALLLTMQMSACTTEEFAATVTDAIDSGTITSPNINSTAVISGVDSGSVIEDVDPNGDNLLEVGGKLNITDSGTGGAAFITETVNGDYGSLTIDAAGIWNYTAYNNQAVIQNLTSSATLTDSLTVSSVSGITHAVVITIMGADETNTPPPGTNNPALISGVDAASVIEDSDPDNDDLLEVSGKLNVTDSDNGEAAFVAKTVNGNYGSLTIDTAGYWNYAADNNQTVIQNLVSGATLTDSLTVSTVDGTTHEVVITIKGINEANNAAVISGVNTGSVTEDAVTTGTNLLEIGGKLNITDSDIGEAAFTAITHNGNHGNYGQLTITGDGNWWYYADNNQAVIQNLASGATLTDNLTVSSIDGTTHTVVITITGTDDTLANVSLSWVAPAEREDNTAILLSEIASYKIYYSSTQGQYTNNIVINDSTATGHTFTNFSSGTYYFVITTIDTDGRESKYSPEVVKVI